MAGNISQHGEKDIYKDGGYIKVGRANSVAAANNPGKKLTLDVSAFPWKNFPSLGSAVNTANEIYKEDTAVDRTLKLKKDANSKLFYIATG